MNWSQSTFILNLQSLSYVPYSLPTVHYSSYTLRIFHFHVFMYAIPLPVDTPLSHFGANFSKNSLLFEGQIPKLSILNQLTFCTDCITVKGFLLDWSICGKYVSKEKKSENVKY